MILYYIILGIITGILAGILGIGGGLVIVPGLLLIFKHFGLFHNEYMHFVSGTSLAIVSLTVVGNIFSFQKQKRIDWQLFKELVYFIVPFNIIGALIATYLPSKVLEKFFGLVILILCINMIINTFKKYKLKIEFEKKEIPFVIKMVIGIVMGLKSGMFGIGGGAFITPVLLKYGIDIKKATATTSALILPLGIIGMLMYIFLGFNKVHFQWTLGYVYFPAVLFVAPISMASTYIGAWMSHKMPKLWLRILFILFLLFVGLHSLLG
jgi:uncharacterized membrane protein YfcA